MIRIDFYDESGVLRDTRIVSAPLRNDYPIDDQPRITYLVSDEFSAHAPYRGGRMEISEGGDVLDQPTPRHLLIQRAKEASLKISAA